MHRRPPLVSAPRAHTSLCAETWPRSARAGIDSAVCNGAAMKTAARARRRGDGVRDAASKAELGRVDAWAAETRRTERASTRGRRGRGGRPCRGAGGAVAARLVRLPPGRTLPSPPPTLPRPAPRLGPLPSLPAPLLRPSRISGRPAPLLGPPSSHILPAPLLGPPSSHILPAPLLGPPSSPPPRSRPRHRRPPAARSRGGPAPPDACKGAASRASAIAVCSWTRSGRQLRRIARRGARRRPPPPFPRSPPGRGAHQPSPRTPAAARASPLATGPARRPPRRSWLFFRPNRSAHDASRIAPDAPHGAMVAVRPRSARPGRGGGRRWALPLLGLIGAIALFQCIGLTSVRRKGGSRGAIEARDRATGRRGGGQGGMGRGAGARRATGRRPWAARTALSSGPPSPRPAPPRPEWGRGRAGRGRRRRVSGGGATGCPSRRRRLEAPRTHPLERKGRAGCSASATRARRRAQRGRDGGWSPPSLHALCLSSSLRTPPGQKQRPPRMA